MGGDVSAAASLASALTDELWGLFEWTIALILMGLAFLGLFRFLAWRKSRKVTHLVIVPPRPWCPWCDDPRCADNSQCDCRQHCGRRYCRSDLNAELEKLLTEGEARG